MTLITSCLLRAAAEKQQTLWPIMSTLDAEAVAGRRAWTHEVLLVLHALLMDRYWSSFCGHGHEEVLRELVNRVSPLLRTVHKSAAMRVIDMLLHIEQQQQEQRREHRLQ